MAEKYNFILKMAFYDFEFESKAEARIFGDKFLEQVKSNYKEAGIDGWDDIYWDFE